MRISDWSSDVCSSDLGHGDDGQSRLLPSPHRDATVGMARGVLDEVAKRLREIVGVDARQRAGGNLDGPVEPAAGGRAPDHGREALDDSGDVGRGRSEEHTSELQSLMRISYAVFCLQKKTITQYTRLHIQHPS